MKEIRLDDNAWSFDINDQVGSRGGFGAVYKGRSSDGTEVAVKQLHISASNAAHRELDIAQHLANHDFSHVILILDSGIDPENDRYYVVMPLAEYSLKDYIQHKQVSVEEAIDILKQVITGLQEASDLVHRDIKPANILFHQGSWKLADFGIARFIEQATSANTLKGALTPPYAAPEQWKMERVSHETDMHAVGCIGYELISGTLPFNGKTRADYQDAHLNQQPPKLQNIEPRLNQFILSCLRKSQRARPSTATALKQLERLKFLPTSSALASASNIVEQQKAKEDAIAAEQRSRLDARYLLFSDGVNALRDLVKDFANMIAFDAPNAVISHGIEHGSTLTGIRLGDGRLDVSIDNQLIPEGSFTSWGVDIICGGLISLTQIVPYRNYEGRSANLWFIDFNRDGEYRWYEIDYCEVFSAKRQKLVPFGFESVRRNIQEIELAGATVMSSVAFANRPSAIDADGFDSFLKRWSDRLAAASTNALRYPTSLPESR